MRRRPLRYIRSISFVALVLAACTPKPANQAASAPAAAPAVDQAAVKVGMDSVRAQYMRLQGAGDAGGVAALYAPDGVADFYGEPRMHGRAAIEAALKGAFGMQKPISVEIAASTTNAVNATTAAELGTYHSMASNKGKANHEWGRYVLGAAKDSTGTWKLSYLMAFPDSTRQDK